MYCLWRRRRLRRRRPLAGILADAVSIEAAIWAVAALTAASGLLVLTRMYKTHPLAPRERDRRQYRLANQAAVGSMPVASRTAASAPGATRRQGWVVARKSPSRRHRARSMRTRIECSPIYQSRCSRFESRFLVR